MNSDAISALVNLSSSIFSSGMALTFALSTLLGITGIISIVSKEARLARQVPGHNGVGKVVAVLLISGGMIALTQLVNAVAGDMGWSGATFAEISWVSESSFGVGAQAANSMLTLISLIGVVYVLMGALRVRRSLKDGHTGLSASEDVSSGIVRIIAGVLAACNPYLLDALQNSLGLAF